MPTHDDPAGDDPSRRPEGDELRRPAAEDRADRDPEITDAEFYQPPPKGDAPRRRDDFDDDDQGRDREYRDRGYSREQSERRGQDDEGRQRSRRGDRYDDRDYVDDRRRPRRRGDRYDDGDYDDDQRRRPRSAEVDPAQFLIPVGVSAWSMASCYMGFVGMCLPLVGPLLAIPALIFGIIAIRQDRKRATSYGKVTSNVRAILGIIFSSISILGNAVILVVWIINWR